MVELQGNGLMKHLKHKDVVNCHTGMMTCNSGTCKLKQKANLNAHLYKHRQERKLRHPAKKKNTHTYINK